MTQPALVLVVCGPGGAGKGTIVEGLLACEPNLKLSRSWTTRHRRADEDADAYEFVTSERFDRQIEAGGFLEWAEFLGNRYGTPVPDLPDGGELLLEIDVQGAATVRERDQQALVVMVLPPSRDEQERRMRLRGDPEPIIAQRLAKADAELATGYGLADMIVVNNNVDEAVGQIQQFLARQRH